MRKTNTLISIILPVYNGEKHLKDAIESCLCQTFKNWELIIVNDASTDNSLAIAEDFQKKDNRIKIISNKTNASLPGSLNKGHKTASGELITWTSDDNILKKNFLENLYENLKNKDCDIIFSNYDIIWSDGSFKREHKAGPIQALIIRNSIGASFLYKKSVFKTLSGYAKDLFLVEDYHFFLMASLFFKIEYLDENLYQYRIHEDSLSGSIQTNKEYNAKHKRGIHKMFEKFGSQIEFNEKTTNFLTDLYLKTPIPIDDFIANRKLMEVDIKKYQQKLNVKNQKSSSLQLIYRKLGHNWLNEKSPLIRKQILFFILKNPFIIIERLGAKQVIRILRKFILEY